MYMFDSFSRRVGMSTAASQNQPSTSGAKEEQPLAQVIGITPRKYCFRAKLTLVRSQMMKDLSIGAIKDGVGPSRQTEASSISLSLYLSSLDSIAMPLAGIRRRRPHIGGRDQRSHNSAGRDFELASS